jgi:uncharacterized membrane protein YphA (DoxX/SURF4 family)
MSEQALPRADFSWGLASLKERPARYAGVLFVLLVRYFLGLFYLGAGINKLRNQWMWTDRLKAVFEQRLQELIDTGALTYGEFYLNYIAIPYLKYFAIPLHIPVAIAVGVGELAVAASLFLGLMTRWGGALALFLMFNFALGGYYDASLLPLCAMAALMIVTPSGRWLGLDRRYHARHPQAAWFR